MPQTVNHIDDAAAGGGSEVQYVNFRVITPGDLQIYATSTGGDAYIYLYLRNADGSLTLLAADDDSGTGLDAQLNLVALAAGEYVVGVSEFPLSDTEVRRGVNDSTPGNTYTVTLTEGPGLTFLVHDGDDSTVDVNVVEDTATVFTAELLANDPTGDNLTVTAVRNVVGGTAVINAAGDVVFTPALNYVGPYSFNFDVTDGNGNITGVQTGLVTNVNDAPDAVTDAFAGTEDTVLNIPAPGVLGNDTDPDGDPLTVTGYSWNPTQGNIVVNPDGSVTFTPAANFNGPFNFSYTVSDGNGGSDTVASVINVAAVDDPYVAQDDTLPAQNEDTPVTYNVSGLIANDTNPDGDPVDVQSITNLFSTINPGVQVGTISYDPVTGNYTITPNTNFNGPAFFDYTALSDGVTDTGRAFVTINSVNDAPQGTNATFTTNEDTPDVLSEADFGFSDPVEGNDFAGVVISSDATNGQVQYDTTGAGTWAEVLPGTFISEADIAAGRLRFAPDANENGTPYGSFNFQVVDNGGTANGGVNTDQSPNTITYNVTPVNDAPVANNDAYTGTEDAPLVVPAASGLLANDNDGDPEVVQAIRVESFSQPVGGTGTVTVNPDGSFTYTPANDFSGVTTFTYTVRDAGADGVFGNGDDAISAPATATITVGNVADNPVAGDDTGVVNEDPAARTSTFEANPANLTVANGYFSEAYLLANDTDPDGGPLELTGVGAAQNGTVELREINGTLYAVFTPTANYSGPAQFDYAVTDPEGNSDIGRVNVTVAERADGAPIATDDTITATEQVSRIVTAAELLANDTDPDNAGAGAGTDTLVIRAIQNIQNATIDQIVTDANGNILQFRLTTQSNVSGLNASFDYVVDDTAARPASAADPRVPGVPDTRTGTDIGTVTVAVTNVNDAPDAVNDTLTPVNEDSAGLTFTLAQLLANDTDPDNAGGTNAGLTVVSVGGLTPGSGASVTTTAGTLTANANGTFTFVPAANYFGPAVFSYTITDGTATDTATVTIPVNSINDAPNANDDGTAPVGLLQLGPCDVLVPEDGSATFTWAQLLANDNVGPANETATDSLRIVSGSSAFGTVTVDTVNQTVTFTPTPGYVGQATFTYVVADEGQDQIANTGDDQTDTATVFVNVVNTIVGSAGNDVINGGAQQSVIIDGGAGDDTLTGTAFTDEIDGGAGNDTINGLDGRDYLRGGTGNDTINGDGGNDFIYTDDGGTDVANGGTGNDGIYAGNALDTTDTNNGGAGVDSLAIRGNAYSGGYLFGVNNLIGIETLIVGSSNNVTTWCGADTDPGAFSYNLITRDANVAAGTILTVIGNGLGNGAPGLQADEAFRFDGSDEKDGAFRIYGGRGDNDFLGGEQNDGFFFETGAWAGGDDTVDGRGGVDSVAFRGDYDGGAAISTNGIVRVENIVLLGEAQTQFGGIDGDSDTFDYTVNVTNTTATTASGILNIRGETLEAGEVLIVNAQNVIDDSLTIFGGASSDTLVGGFQGLGLGGIDLIYGGRGGDFMNGGGFAVGFGSQIDGTNVYGYMTAADSASIGGTSVGNIDRISGFDFTVDKIDINAGGPAVNGLVGGIAGLNVTDTNAVFNGNLTLQDSSDPALDFDTQLAAQINEALNPGQGAFLQVTSGGLGGSTVFVADVNGNGSYDAGTDLVIIFDNLVSQLPPTTEWII